MNVEADIVLYMKKDQRPSLATLKELIGMLEDPVEDLVRKDASFRKLGLTAGDYVGNADAVAAVLDEHIELLQRPILVRGGKAIIGRPKDRIGAFLG